MVQNHLSAVQPPKKRLVFRWTAPKGLIAIILFLIAATLIECLVMVYALNLGVKDETVLKWDLQFPENVTITVSPLFHIAPIAVIITLVFSWSYLTKHIAVKPYRIRKEKMKQSSKPKKTRGFSRRIKGFFRKMKSGLLKVKAVSYLWQKIHFGRAVIKSAFVIIMVFAASILVISLLTYPQLIYHFVLNTFATNDAFHGFVKSTSSVATGFAEVLAPIGWVCSAIKNALISVAPGFRDFGVSVGNLIKPLVDLDGFGKYLVFQNVAAWVSAVTALAYGWYARKGYGRKRR
jgi:ABC-type glycerol-3-phosphate transport system permease component